MGFFRLQGANSPCLPCRRQRGLGSLVAVDKKNGSCQLSHYSSHQVLQEQAAVVTEAFPLGMRAGRCHEEQDHVCGGSLILQVRQKQLRWR